MTAPANDSGSEPVSLPIKWNAEDWSKLKAAADLLTEREHFKVTPTDIVRSGAMRRAEEILAEAAA